jgi:hypothetical protein
MTTNYQTMFPNYKPENSRVIELETQKNIEEKNQEIIKKI